MTPVSSLPESTQERILSAPFRHFFPWRCHYKADSVSTPVRIILNPSMTWLNLILAKGVNMLPMISSVLYRFSCHREAWGTDISKMYNQLYLAESDYPYSLFLFHESMDPATEPVVYVLTRAWYGVSSTGNQAGAAIDRLAKENASTFPMALGPLTKDRYVDDCLPGADTKEECDIQISQVSDCLAKGGFSMKFVARSGLPPPAKASADGTHVSCLGLQWDTEKDLMSLGCGPMVLQHKVRGKKGIPQIDVSNPAGLKQALTEGFLSRAGLVGRCAEMFDPAGYWEPLKVQLKLAQRELNSLAWDEPVPPEQAEMWVKLLSKLEEIREITAPRFLFPKDCPPNAPIRLICLADASAYCIGAAIYAGIELPDGSWTCSLIGPKSRLAKDSVPRNELSAKVLMGELALSVLQSIGYRVSEAWYFSDSEVAICWMLNTSKQLRMWVHNRVESARFMIKRTVEGKETVPLYHIPGKENLADLLTKTKDILPHHIDSSSQWRCGLDWMRLPSHELPKQQFVQPKSVEDGENFLKETFIDITPLESESRTILLTGLSSSSDATHARGGVIKCWLTDNFDFIRLGWNRTRARIKLVLLAVTKLIHRGHPKKVLEIQ